VSKEASPFPLWQDIVFSLILGLSPSEAFASLYYKMFFLDYQQKKPLKYYILPFIAVYRFMVNLIMKKEILTVSNTGMDYCNVSSSGKCVKNPSSLKRGIRNKCYNYIWLCLR